MNAITRREREQYIEQVREYARWHRLTLDDLVES
jgi:hypothetical protein